MPQRPAPALAAPKASVSPAETATWSSATLRRPVSFAEAATPKSGVLVIAAGSAAEASERASVLLTPDAGASLRRAVESAAFDFSSGDMLVLRAFSGLEQVLVLGLGKSPASASLQSAGEALRIAKQARRLLHGAALQRSVGNLRSVLALVAVREGDAGDFHQLLHGW